MAMLLIGISEGKTPVASYWGTQVVDLLVSLLRRYHHQKQSSIYRKNSIDVTPERVNEHRCIALKLRSLCKCQQ
jgi:hypothetical protein